MRDFLNFYMHTYQTMLAQEKEMCAEFKAKAGKAFDDYWDACKYPRKTKKKIRKIAKTDYLLYTQMAKPMF